MIIITTRSYPPELGGMQSLMGGLAIHINNFHPIKVLANSFAGDESYDKKNNFNIKTQIHLDIKHVNIRIDKLYQVYKFTSQY